MEDLFLSHGRGTDLAGLTGNRVPSLSEAKSGGIGRDHSKKRKGKNNRINFPVRGVEEKRERDRERERERRDDSDFNFDGQIISVEDRERDLPVATVPSSRT